MKAPYIVNHNGKYYKAGEELPPEVEEQLKPSLEKREKLEEELDKIKSEKTIVKATITTKQ